MLLDEKPVRLAKAENYQAIHLMVPRRGVAVHINAFNFPSWGLWEKAAVSLLAGMPVFAKPASATALLAHEMVRDVVAAKALPDGRAEPLGRRRRRPARPSHVRRRDRLHRLGRYGGARARPPQRGGAQRAGEHRGRQHQCGAAGARRGGRRRGVRRLRARSGARDDGEGRAEMHGDPPHLRAGGQGRRYRRGAVRQAQEHQGRRPAQRGHAHGPAGDARAAAAAFDGIRKLASEAEFVIGDDQAARARRHRRGQGRLRRADAAARSRIRGMPRRCTRSRCSGRRRPSCPTATRRTPARRWRAAAARWWRRSTARTRSS